MVLLSAALLLLLCRFAVSFGRACPFYEGQNFLNVLELPVAFNFFCGGAFQPLKLHTPAFFLAVKGIGVGSR